MAPARPIAVFAVLTTTLLLASPATVAATKTTKKTASSVKAKTTKKPSKATTKTATTIPSSTPTAAPATPSAGSASTPIPNAASIGVQRLIAVGERRNNGRNDGVSIGYITANPANGMICATVTAVTADVEGNAIRSVRLVPKTGPAIVLGGWDDRTPSTAEACAKPGTNAVAGFVTKPFLYNLELVAKDRPAATFVGPVSIEGYVVQLAGTNLLPKGRTTNQGAAVLAVDGNGSLCSVLLVRGDVDIRRISLFKGDEGGTGPRVATVGFNEVAAGNGVGYACQAIDASARQSLRANPAGFYAEAIGSASASLSRGQVTRLQRLAPTIGLAP